MKKVNEYIKQPTTSIWKASWKDFANLKTPIRFLSAIRLLKQAGYQLTESNIRKGFSQVCELTGLMGRWQKLEK